MSGYLANPTPDTSYEPKLCVDASDEHTPIDFFSTRNFAHAYDATTVATTEDLDVPRHSGAHCSSKQSSHRVETGFIMKLPLETVGRL